MSDRAGKARAASPAFRRGRDMRDRDWGSPMARRVKRRGADGSWGATLMRATGAPNDHGASSYVTCMRIILLSMIVGNNII